MTNETTPNPYCYEDSRHNPLYFDNNQSATAQTVSNTQFSTVPISENQNSGKLASAMSLPTVAQTNVSQQFQNPLYPTVVHFSNGNRTEEPNNGIVFPSNTTLNNKGTNLVCCTSSQPPNCPLTPENLFTNYQTAILPPFTQHISQTNISGNSKQIPNLSFSGKQLFQPRTELQTETIPFENNFNLQTTNKNSIKLPPITISNFNGNPLKYHEWINNFFNLVHNNTSLTDTHRITYLQNSVVGKAKEKIQAYSCDPAYYAIALKELMDHFGDPSIFVNAFINQLEAWRPNNDYNKQSFVSFASFPKRLVQAFEYLGFKADLQSSTLMKKAKEKIPHNILIKWTEYTITSIGNQPTFSEFQKWLEVQSQVCDKTNRENAHKPFNNWNTFGQNSSSISRINNNNDNRNSNAMNQFPNISQNNWKPNSLHSSRPANQHGQPPFPPRKDADQSNKSCEKCKGSHILATCPEYQKCAPDQRYDIVSKNNLCSNCLSNRHLKQSCPSTKRCQTCKGFHHTTLHDPSKQVKRPTAAFSTSNPNQPTQNLASPQNTAILSTTKSKQKY